MGNLGWYQTLTSVAKKVGGPKKLVTLLIGGGFLAGVATTKGAESLSEKINQKKELKRKTLESLVVYAVTKDGCSNEGVKFYVGDKFTVLEKDGDAVLIEKKGDCNNPYFVSGRFLSSISTYKI